MIRTNQHGWTSTEFWENYMQLTVVENAFRVLKSHLRLRPVCDPEQTRILEALNLELPERLTPDSICSEDLEPKN